MDWQKTGMRRLQQGNSKRQGLRLRKFQQQMQEETAQSKTEAKFITKEAQTALSASNAHERFQLGARTRFQTTTLA
jgi:hypothetical protein